MPTIKFESPFPKLFRSEERFLDTDTTDDLCRKLNTSVTEYIKRRQQQSNHLESLVSELREGNRKYDDQNGMNRKVEIALQESQAALDQFERSWNRSATSNESFVSRILSQLSDLISYVLNIFSSKKN